MKEGEGNCKECAKHIDRIEKLEQRIHELEFRLKQNSQNSSKPPSSDSPFGQRPKKPPTGRKPGGQPGHEGITRTFLPPEKVNKMVRLVPSKCRSCSRPLSITQSLKNLAPKRHQVIDIPPISPIVTEYQLEARTCQ